MATINPASPAGTTVERTNLSNVVGVLALLAVIALIYFIARGRQEVTPTQPSSMAPVQQGEQVQPQRQQ